MKIRNSLGNGVRGSSVTNFALRDSVVDNNGDDAATDEAGLHFTNLAGTSEFTRTLVANSPEDNARVVNSSGTLSQLNVTDSTFRDTDTVSPGNNGLLLQADGGSITADVLGNTFLRNRANGLQVITNGTGLDGRRGRRQRRGAEHVRRQQHRRERSPTTRRGRSPTASATSRSTGSTSRRAPAAARRRSTSTSRARRRRRWSAA